MNRRAPLLAAVLLLVAPAAVARRAPPPPAAPLSGTWRNPAGTVEVRIEGCGSEICGIVTAATAEAIADARDAGQPTLVGMQLLHDYHPDGPSHWSGTVFVPDLGRTLSSHIDLLDSAHARIAGCLWRRYLCKSQVWLRI